MDLVVAGSPSTFVIALDDGAGNVLDVSSISYLIKDETDRVLVPSTALSGFGASSPTASISVSGAINSIIAPLTSPPQPSLATSAYRQLRVVVLTCTLTAGGTVTLEDGYCVETLELIVGVNSFQSLSYAKMTALDVPNLALFGSTNERTLVFALSQAAERIKQYRFRLDETEWGYQQNMVKGWFVGNLNLISPGDFAQLPEQFKRALRMAQVAEAETILSGPGLTEKRGYGLLSETIGEVRQVFNQGVPIRTNVSRPALSYLGRFINYSPRIARG